MDGGGDGGGDWLWMKSDECSSSCEISCSGEGAATLESVSE